MVKGINNHIFNLPYLRENKFNNLLDANILKIDDIPDDYDLTDNQVIVRDSVINNEIIIQPGLKEKLEEIQIPIYYLDFETVQTAIPLYPDISPYSQIPTQYSLHICSEVGKIIDHKEFISDPSRDCRRELAEQLIEDCGTEGSILEYTTFEERIIKILIESNPDLENELKNIINRLIDLCAILNNYFYHYDFKGSYSIKRTLPVLVSDLGYEGLGVRDGLEASAVFAFMAKGKYDEEEIRKKREELLEYCKMDTLAMVRLHEELIRFTGRYYIWRK